MNGIVSGYFDFAEVQAMRHRPMHMSDYVEHLDRVLSSTGEQLLVGAGKVSHKQAIKKANREYQRFAVQNLSPVEEAYLQTIKEVEKTAKKRRRRIEHGSRLQRKKVSGRADKRIKKSVRFRNAPKFF